nr:hypothetical protein [Tanacetum cinerariifolium]
MTLTKRPKSFNKEDGNYGSSKITGVTDPYMKPPNAYLDMLDTSGSRSRNPDTPEPSAAVQTKAAQDKARPTRIIKKPTRYLE